jgi:hypothetical protein
VTVHTPEGETSTYEVTDIVVHEMTRLGYSNHADVKVVLDREPELPDWEFYTTPTFSRGDDIILAYKADGLLADFGIGYPKDQGQPHRTGMGALSAYNCKPHPTHWDPFRERLVPQYQHGPKCVGVDNVWSSNSSSVNDILGTELAEGACSLPAKDFDGKPHYSWMSCAFHVRTLNVLLEQHESPYQMHLVRFHHGEYWVPLVSARLHHKVMRYGHEQCSIDRPWMECFEDGHYQPVADVFSHAELIK